MKGKKRKEKVDKETMCDDWCFVCKDGGSLFICEYKCYGVDLIPTSDKLHTHMVEQHNRDCLKAYHAECVGKDESFFDTKSFTCEWHSCFTCKKGSKYQCYCCTRAFCQRCISDAEFAKVRGSKGFCNHCVKILLLGEEHKEVDSDGDQVDMKDRNTYECLLYEYWLVMKGKENLTLEDLHLADNIFKRGKKQALLSDSYKSEQYEDEISDSTSEESSRSEFSLSPSKKRKRSKGQKASKNKEVKSNKKEFVGWGSKPLIDFLESIGKDTSKELAEHNVVSIINSYINEKKLFNPEKKKKIVCDDRLYALFGKKIFLRNSIGNLLQLHFRTIAEFYEQDQLDYSSEEKSENENTVGKKQKKAVTSKKSQEKEVIIEPVRSRFACINMENIKLVYLRGCLVTELLKEFETFESKIIGSFVKVKSDPNDCMQNNPYQLVQVTGVKNAVPGGKKEDILLQVSNRLNDFPISKLSDGNFSEQECEDLSQRVKRGELKKPTIVELEEKAKSLHLVITKHWIAKELKSLQIQIDNANEKGQRVEFFHYMEIKSVLQTEDEQKRLLEEVPKVIADILEIEPICNDDNKELNHGDEIKPKSVIDENLKILDKNWGDHITSSGNKAVTDDNSMSGNSGSISANYRNGTTREDQVFSKIQDKVVAGDNSMSCNSGSVSASYRNGTSKGDQFTSKTQDSYRNGTTKEDPAHSKIQDEEESVCNDQSDAIQKTKLRRCKSKIKIESDDVEKKMEKNIKASLIVLSSDDDRDDISSISLSKREEPEEDLDAPNWLYMGPNGEREGPLSLSILKEWRKLSSYALKLKVWKISESEKNAILLSSIGT